MRYGKDFFVDIPSIFYLEYRQGDKSMKVEMDFRDHIPYLDKAAILAWDPPYSSELITEEERCVIFKNIIYYLKKIRHARFETE